MRPPCGQPFVLALLLWGCAQVGPRPLIGLERALDSSGLSSEPALSGRWLAYISSNRDRAQVQLVDVDRQLRIALPGLNRVDAQPLHVAVDGTGQRLAVVRQLQGRTELVLYRRLLASVERIAMQPAGVPNRVSLRADGRGLAVQVSRNGLWQVDVIRLP